ncbi:hypothetical protein VTL71DRAFT_9741 [Oculimacula yallundae]|uniref:Uncharacterized protein n=1 Tax=Oculimacula yallundae TaxID=86028 RepID=A0ABR4BTB9_9HELO
MPRTEVLEEISPTTITIEGTPAQQNKILTMLQSYGLVNHHKEITPTQANNFHGYLKSQDEYEVSLEAQVKDKQSMVDKSNKEYRRISRHLIESRLRYTELGNDLKMESDRADNLEVQLTESQGQIDEAVSLIMKGEKEIKYVTEEMERMIQELQGELKEAQEDLQDWMDNQKVLSDKILALKQRNKVLENNEKFLRMKADRLVTDVKASKKEISLKRKRCKSGDKEEIERYAKRAGAAGS